MCPVSAWKCWEWGVGFAADGITFAGASLIAWEAIFKTRYRRKVSNVEKGLGVLSRIGRVKSKGMPDLGPKDAERLVRIDFTQKGWVCIMVGFFLQMIDRVLDVTVEMMR